MRRDLLAAAVAALHVACAPKPTAPSASAEVISGAKADCREGNVEACHVACSNNVASACNEAGRSYELGIGVTRSGVAANTFYRKACDLGEINGCYNAAYLLETGGAGRRDVGCALALYRLACEQGNHGQSCLNIGLIYKSGIDVPRDEDRAREAFKRACDAGHAGGCMQLQSK